MMMFSVTRLCEFRHSITTLKNFGHFEWGSFSIQRNCEFIKIKLIKLSLLKMAKYSTNTLAIWSL